MMQQYMRFKSQYPDAIMFFRMGDFFEMFFEDAIQAAEILGITQTYRNKMNDEPIPMAGIPHHAYKGYVHRLTQEGWTVVICDQVEEATPGKLVDRQITRIVTPGMVLDPDDLEAGDNNYLAAAFFDKKKSGLARLDLTTGEFKVTEISARELLSETQRVAPREMLLSQDQTGTPLSEEYQSQLPDVCFQLREGREFSLKEATDRLCDQFDVHSLEGFGLGEMKAGIRAAGAILAYVKETQKSQIPHLNRLEPYTIQQFMVLDQVSRTNLELLETLHERKRKGSLLGYLDKTLTPMGGRKLKQWLLYPLLNRGHIEARHNAVELFVQNGSVRGQIRDVLKGIRDLERLNGKISGTLATPRDLYLLRSSLEAVPSLIEILDQMGPDGQLLAPVREGLFPIPAVVEDIQASLMDEPPNHVKDGGFIREGFHAELDRHRDIAANGKDHILAMEARERESTGISSLKIKFNRVFGYYIEVSRPNLHLVPEDRYVRKQTMTNHERYFTDELKEFEEEILGAEEKILKLEQELFIQLRERIALYSEEIARLADTIASLDVLACFGEVAINQDYCRPEMTDGTELDITSGRHPVVESLMRAGEFVPNDLSMPPEQTRFVLITGPNMSGKSTVMRQVALFALLAQVGSFVPAEKATIGICDRIFTRVGASDNLAGGQSTFMVEMTETSNILHNATSKSLVILDEIGRGTSTFDGLSIAWAVAEHLHNHTACRTLFATHYHELTELEMMLSHFRNMNVAINEWQGDILFLHKLVEGGSNRSYGIQVARLAGLPKSVVKRAHRILGHLEQGKLPSAAEMGGVVAGQQRQLSLFAPVGSTITSPLEEELQALNLDEMSPIDALRILHRWKEDWCTDDPSSNPLSSSIPAAVMREDESSF